MFSNYLNEIFVNFLLNFITLRTFINFYNIFNKTLIFINFIIFFRDSRNCFAILITFKTKNFINYNILSLTLFAINKIFNENNQFNNQFTRFFII